MSIEPQSLIDQPHHEVGQPAANSPVPLADSELSSKIKKPFKSLALITLLTLFLVALGGWRWYQLSTTPILDDATLMKNAQTNQDYTDSGTNDATNNEAKAATRILYAGPHSLISYDISTMTSQTLIQDVDNVTFSYPRWHSANEISYERCVSGAPNGGQENCELVKRNITSNQATTFFQRTNQETADGKKPNAYFQGSDFDNTQSKVAYLTRSDLTQIDNPRTIHELHLFDTLTNQDMILDTYVQFGGRGGSYDDSFSIAFSPDDRYLMLNNTSLLPGNEETDRGSLFVYNMQNTPPTLVWSAPKIWTTHAQWVSNHTLLAKTIKNGPDLKTVPKHQLVEIDLVTGAVNELSEAQGWGGPFVALNNDRFLFTYYPDQQIQPLQQGIFNMITKDVEFSPLKFIPIKSLGNDQLLVYTVKPCDNSPDASGDDMCGFDAYHGVKQAALAIHNLKTAKNTELSNQTLYLNYENVDVLFE